MIAPQLGGPGFRVRGYGAIQKAAGLFWGGEILVLPLLWSGAFRGSMYNRDDVGAP